MVEKWNREEQLLRDTLLNLLELFQADLLSGNTEEGLVRIIEGLRFDLRSRFPDVALWAELDKRLSGMGREHRRRFEHLVGEMVLQDGGARGACR